MDRYSVKGLIDEYARKIKHDNAWGISLAGVLIEDKDWDSELWQSIFNGLSNSIEDEKDWERFFQLFLRMDKLKGLEYELSEFLSRKINSEEGRIPKTSLAVCNQLARNLTYELIDEDEEFDTNLDCLGLAINRPAGKLCEYYLDKISREVNESGERELLDYYKEIFNEVISADSDFSNLFVVVLVSQIHFLSSLDYQWTKAKLLPRLSSNIDIHLYQAWNGFLVWGKWNSLIIEDLIPAYRSFFPSVDNLDNRLKQSFSDHIASICVLTPYDPFEEDFILDFINTTNIDVHEYFSNQLTEYFKVLNSNKHEAVWNDWLRRYLKKRKMGIPCSMSDREIENTLFLFIYIDGVKDEFASMLLDMEFPQFENSFFYSELEETTIPEDHPEITVNIINKLLKATKYPFWDTKTVVKIIEKIIKCDNKNIKSALLEICQSLSRLRFNKASELKEKIECIY